MAPQIAPQARKRVRIRGHALFYGAVIPSLASKAVERAERLM